LPGFDDSDDLDPEVVADADAEGDPEGAADPVLEPGAADELVCPGALVCVGAWVGAGVGDGLALGCGAGLVPGGVLSLLPCHENATYPPSGTCCPPAPLVAYVQRPDSPSDQYSAQ
jgi:hypothetical protein